MISYTYNSHNLGTKTAIPRFDTAPHGVDQFHWLITDYMGLSYTATFSNSVTTISL